MLFCGRLWFQAAGEMNASVPAIGPPWRQFDAKIGCNRNRCHCSVQLLINERFRRLQQATGGADLERGFYCCSLNKYLSVRPKTF
jgi:hypothetical protein